MPYNKARVGSASSLWSRAPRNSTTAAWWPAAASARAFATTGDASSRRWSRVWSLDIGMLSPAYQLTAHSINASATAYSQKCGNAYMNDFSSSDWLAPICVHASLRSSRYQRPSSLASIWLSVLSTTPSPFRSPPAPPYQSLSCAGAPNCSPLGSSETPIFVVSMVTEMRTESPTASSPMPGTNVGSVVASVSTRRERRTNIDVSKGWALDCLRIRRQYWTQLVPLLPF